MCEPKKHHYVPQFYLRHFSPDGQSIWQIVKVKQSEAQPTCFRTAIRDTAAVRDYHRLDCDGAEDANAIEKGLADVEGQLADAVVRALESGVEDQQRCELLAVLVSVLMMRVPRYKRFIEESLRANVRATGLMMERKGDLPPVPEALKELLSFETLQIHIHNWICVAHMFELACDPQALGLLSTMRLSLWRTNGNGELLSSDNPVSIFRPDAKRGDHYGTGIGDQRVQISLPLARDALLLLTWDKDAPTGGVLDVPLIDEYNRRTIVSADKVVFASTNDDAFLRMVDDLRHCSTSIRIETADCGNEFFHLMTQWPVMPPEEYQQ